MSPSGDYPGEMFGSKETEEILAGGRGDSDAARRAARAVARLREELLVEPDERLAQRHLDAMRAGRSWSDARPRRNGRKQVAALALAASLMLGAGIAGALTLPDKASERAGERTADVELPENAKGPGDGGKETTQNGSSAHGQAVSEVARDDSAKGCEHGRAVSAAASSKAEDNRNSAGNRGDCGPKQGVGSKGQKGNDGNVGNQGKGNKGNHGEGNNGKGPGARSDAPKDPPGQSSKAGSQGQAKPSGAQSSNAGGNGKSDLALENAPGQVAKAAKEAKGSNEASETNITPDGLPADV